jgi:hypothetical protein
MQSVKKLKKTDAWKMPRSISGYNRIAAAGGDLKMAIKPVHEYQAEC